MNLRNFKLTVIPNGFIVFTVVVSLLTLLIIFLTKNVTRPVQVSNQLEMEYAYFEGQRDAMKGDTRIKFNELTQKYSWTKSCWDSGMKPIYDPAISEDRNYFLNK